MDESNDASKTSPDSRSTNNASEQPEKVAKFDCRATPISSPSELKADIQVSFQIKFYVPD